MIESLMAEMEVRPVIEKGQDLTGLTFGRLTVIKRSSMNKWECQCKCGKTKHLYRPLLVQGASSSCGCLRSEMTKARRRLENLPKEEIDKRNDKDAKAPRTCAVCKITKTGEDFYPLYTHRNGRIRRLSHCKTCSTKIGGQIRRNRKSKDPKKASERNRETYFKRHYGLTTQNVADKIKQQNGRCAICTRHMVKPHVDHCHTTGRNRAMLCHTCNVGLGSFGDSPEFLRRAADYLERYSGVASSVPDNDGFQDLEGPKQGP